MSFYADSSFLVSLYIKDGHFPAAQECVAANPDLCLTPLQFAEWTHAVEQHVLRGEVARSEADRLHQRFSADLIAGFWRQVAVPESAFAHCAELGRRFAARLATRTLDSLHVAIAFALNADAFWSFDERQNRLAQAVGFRTLADFPR